MSSVVNFIRKKIAKTSKKDKLNKKDEMLASQAEKIAQLTADLVRVQQESGLRLVMRQEEVEQLREDKTILEKRIRQMELDAVVTARPLRETITILQDKLNKVCQDNREREKYTHHTLSNCHNTIHQLRQQKNTDVHTINKLKVQITDLKNAPKPKPIGIPTCQICMFEFSETRRIPKMLACGHTLCEQCILQIREGVSLKCPFDRKEQYMGLGGVAGLPKNFAILEVIEGKKKENTPMGKMSSEPSKGGKRRKTFVANNHSSLPTRETSM